MLISIGLAACGADLRRTHQGPAGSGRVGDACQKDADCEQQLICLTELPGGSCTRTCDERCPDGALCVQVTFPGGEGQLCAPICTIEPPSCRSAYLCQSVGRQRVCSPS